MGLADTLARGRAAARRRMVDEFEIYAPTGPWTFDPDTKKNIRATALLLRTVGYIPPAAGVLTQDSEAGARTVASSNREARIPWETAAIPHGATAVCVAIGAGTPPRMLGKSYRVGGSDGASQGTACHLEILEVLT